MFHVQIRENETIKAFINENNDDCLPLCNCLKFVPRPTPKNHIVLCLSCQKHSLAIIEVDNFVVCNQSIAELNPRAWADESFKTLSLKLIRNDTLKYGKKVVKIIRL
jgi:hypothetical protein